MKKSHTDRLLSGYLLSGIVSFSVFVVFIVLLSLAVILDKTDIILYFIVLLSGFLWIGVTSISRHIFVMLKKFIGKEVSALEFLSTQFVVLLFPFLYMKLRKEVRIYGEKEVKTDEVEGGG